ncbi:hypothetical protein [Thomasclavelia ramosa]|uniref:hypothetical protein n=1 Tax=Thomasclavelia ramosa TaxID=1547 RepID=UPI000E501844|nr:hypothetical protein [Thomasclavelia ramosa]RGX62714.1 hypothetical protein DXA75_09875 [Thomasclavelia ramosa]
MSRSLEETLVAFAEKYQGDFKEIFRAVAYKERLTDNEIDKLNENVDEKYVTVMSEDYPEVLKGIDCPPIVMFYEGNMDLLNKEVYELASPLDKSKRVFFKLDITNDGMDYFIGCENSHDLVGLVDFFIDQHPEMNFKNYRDGDALCA